MGTKLRHTLTIDVRLRHARIGVNANPTMLPNCSPFVATWTANVRPGYMGIWSVYLDWSTLRVTEIASDGSFSSGTFVHDFNVSVTLSMVWSGWGLFKLREESGCDCVLFWLLSRPPVILWAKSAQVSMDMSEPYYDGGKVDARPLQK